MAKEEKKVTPEVAEKVPEAQTPEKAPKKKRWGKRAKAAADKPEKPEKTNWLAKIFQSDYKWEGLILAFLSIVAIVLAALLFSKILVINKEVFLIGDYPNAFAGILIGLGVIGLGVSIFPYYKPSIEEMRKVTWPARGRILRETLIALTFSLILIFFFFALDTGYGNLVNKIRELVG